MFNRTRHLPVARMLLRATLVIASTLGLAGCGVEGSVDEEFNTPSESETAAQNLTSNSQIQSVVFNNNVIHAYSGSQLSVKITTIAPCGAGGCAFSSYTTDRGLIPVPSSFKVPEGATTSTTNILVGNTTYASPLTVYAGNKYAWLEVYPALGTPAADGSYAMLGFGSSSRTGTGSVTKSLNLQMAKNNCEYQISRYATRQCQAAIPGGVLTRVGGYIIKGEYVGFGGKLTYDVSQKLKCSPQ